MPTMWIIFLRSNIHWDNLERFAAVMRVIFGRWTVASAPEYFLLRFFFCFTIDLLYIKASLSDKSRATDSGRIADNWPLDYRHFYNNLLWYLKSWPYRLTVRTPGFHPGNPGSIPGKITKNLESFIIIAQGSEFLIYFFSTPIIEKIRNLKQKILRQTVFEFLL